jgi:serine/arginine repetitive matrix protein 2
LKETHEIAKAQQEKNAKLREAFGISEYFVEGTSFDADRKAREDLAKSEAIQKEIQADKTDQKKYALVRTPSPESDQKAIESNDDDKESKKKVEKKKKKKREL